MFNKIALANSSAVSLLLRLKKRKRACKSVRKYRNEEKASKRYVILPAGVTLALPLDERFVTYFHTRLGAIPDIILSLPYSLRLLQRLVHDDVSFTAKISGFALMPSLRENLCYFHGQLLLFWQLWLRGWGETSGTGRSVSRWFHSWGVSACAVDSYGVHCRRF